MPARRKKRRKCKNCDRECKRPVDKYCNNICQLEYQHKVRIEKWLSGELEGGSVNGIRPWAKRYLVETRGNKCEKCGWCEVNPVTGNVPIEVNHIVSNSDHRPENLELLCPNCHSLTPNFRALNKGHGRAHRRSNKPV